MEKRKFSDEEKDRILREYEQSPFGEKYPMTGQSWRRNWQEVIPFFHYPEEIRTMIYTTNALESVNMRIRKVIKNRGQFPSDEAAIKLIYLALRNTMLKWKSSPLAWPAAARPICHHLWGEI